ncbi:MAG: 3-phosphoshikimate 1-carboxyvinyltransferase [Hadesarchaea archaeon]|nr:3-phosphoshikimate 1-carboxyvinyltransferase [Hadesarchaea archaeon]
MAQIRIRPSKLGGEIEAQPSKSYTHRALCIGLLADGESGISGPLQSLDTEATVRALEILGGDLEKEDKVWRVTGTGGRITPRGKIINVMNSGTTLRFMSAIAALSPKPVTLTGDESILTRPMGPLIKALRNLGARAVCRGGKGRPPVTVGGGIRGGETQITGAISSQFISALLLACPYASEDVSISVEEEPRSKPYILMTLEILKLAGGKISRNRDLTEFDIPGGQIFNPIDYAVPGDFSSASFILGGAALTGSSVRVRGLDVNDVQGDKKILTFLEEFGAEVKVKRKTIEVSGTGELYGIEADCGDTPDLVPVLAVLGAAAEGRTILTNMPHLRFKEVDRLRALSVELKKLGARVREREDELQIWGTRQLRGGKFNSYGDHRMAMALAMAGLAAKGETVVEGAECISVSYPNFVKDMQGLGANIEKIV